jgi:protocatechuate 3,4-dioxygenase beta subunit
MPREPGAQKRLAVTLLAVLGVAGLGWWLFPSLLERPQGGGADPAPAAAAGHERALAASAPASAGVDRTPAPAEGGAGSRAGATGTLLVHVRWSDGSPAGDVTVYLSERRPGISRPLASGRSDAGGDARFAGLRAGKVQACTDRGSGGSKEAEVAAERTQEVTIELAAGVTVSGLVQDRSGQPVPAADIWLSAWQSRWMGGAVVGRSDARGRFSVRGVPKDQSLGAIVPGRAPSELVDLDLLDTSSEPVRVTLVVDEAGGALAGRVLDPSGQGVAGACIAVGKATRIDPRLNGTQAESWTPRTIRTDEQGAFRIDGLKPGKQPVEVWAARFPFWHGESEVKAGETTELVIRLVEGVTVHGFVRGPDDAPLAGAIVRCFPVAIREDYLQFGQYDYDSTFGCPFAVAGADGSYRLERAAPGLLSLYASPGEPRRGRGDRSMPRAHVELQAEPGATLEWNPSVTFGAMITASSATGTACPCPACS